MVLDYVDRLKNKRYLFVVESKKLFVVGDFGCKKRVSFVGLFSLVCKFSLMGFVLMDVDFFLSDLEEFEVRLFF